MVKDLYRVRVGLGFVTVTGCFIEEESQGTSGSSSGEGPVEGQERYGSAPLSLYLSPSNEGVRSVLRFKEITVHESLRFKADLRLVRKKRTSELISVIVKSRSLKRY